MTDPDDIIPEEEVPPRDLPPRNGARRRASRIEPDDWYAGQPDRADAPHSAESGDVPKPKAKLWGAADIVNEVRRRSVESIVPLTLGNQTVVEMRQGQTCLLVSWSSGGKSTLALAMLLDHARHRGPAIYLSREMAMDEAGARVIGIATERTWWDVQRGAVDDADAIAAFPDRLYLVERSDITADGVVLDEIAAQVRKKHPGEPLLIALDYAQITKGFGDGARDRRDAVEGVVETLATWAHESRAVVILISQSSRGNSSALRKGEKTGRDAMDTGAETPALERWAHVMLVIGERRDDDDGMTSEIDVHIPKVRQGRAGGRVQLRGDLARGTLRIFSREMSAEAVKADVNIRKRADVDRAVRQHLAASDVALSKADLAKAARKNAAEVRRSVDRLLEDPLEDVVEVKDGKWTRIWTRSHAIAAGLQIIERDRAATTPSVTLGDEDVEPDFSEALGAAP